ncbi:Stimulator of interferon genes protein [Eumeta japonica]|uniref:Stimulator of interferon genes protein n=1 Tax=Eumeta variegata TaxID=151549 RepID=A0A4C1TVE8_EUMVA|nr:Stimulator of interferon genes protein [Eumeta japonica]
MTFTNIKEAVAGGFKVEVTKFDHRPFHILPNDGAQFGGFEKNIERYEAVHKVTFPVKKLFLIIPKKLYCPPDLAEFNKNDKNLPYMEVCSSLEDVEKNVAGVNRKYRSSIYKIYQNHTDPVYIAAECATPLHTLQKVKERRAEYKELANADFEEIVDDFCKMLQSITDNSKNCYNKIELVYYDVPSYFPATHAIECGVEENLNQFIKFANPEIVRPYPKACPRKLIKNSRKKGKTRILTDTPEKRLIELAEQETQTKNNAKRERQEKRREAVGGRRRRRRLAPPLLRCDFFLDPVIRI